MENIILFIVIGKQCIHEGKGYKSFRFSSLNCFGIFMLFAVFCWVMKRQYIKDTR